jgi:hypothetical protein
MKTFGLFRVDSRHGRTPDCQWNQNDRQLSGYLPGEIHFFAAYIVPEDTWYIIPLPATGGCTSLLVRRRNDRRPGLYDAYREAWHLLRSEEKVAGEAAGSGNRVRSKREGAPF